MLPGLSLGADVKAGGINLLTRRRLLAGWSEYEVLMETPLSARLDRRRRVSPVGLSACPVADGEAAHG